MPKPHPQSQLSLVDIGKLSFYITPFHFRPHKHSKSGRMNPSKAQRMMLLLLFQVILIKISQVAANGVIIIPRCHAAIVITAVI